MFALIQKSDNKVLRIAQEGATLAEEKPFYWLECPADCTPAWSFDGETLTPPRPPVSSASAVIAAKLAAINTACEAEIAAISAGYPASEVLSWTKQEAEARAFTADAEAVTPLLDSLAAARGITKAELASRVIAKADLFAQFSGAIIGKRQALEDQIDVISGSLWGEELAAPIMPELQTQLDTVQWNAEGEQP